MLNVVLASRTNLDLTLRRPLVVPLRQGEESVTELRFYADDVRGLVSLVRARPGSRGGSAGLTRPFTKR